MTRRGIYRKVVRAEQESSVVVQGDARHLPLPDGSVHCVVTSPPYWGLRDYKIEPLVWGGAAGCEHSFEQKIIPAANGIVHQGGMSGETLSGSSATRKPRLSETCQKCGAWRGCLGLEPTPELFIQHIVEIFREIRRVLRDDGTCWANLGDSYTSGGRKERDPGQSTLHPAFEGDNFADGLRPGTPPGLKPKDLCGIPWRVALALQADGWYLRSDIIWSKPNPMPESVQDRPTKSHEYVFLLAKSPRYFYDALAIAEPSVTEDPRRPYGSQGAWDLDGRPVEQRHGGEPRYNAPGKNSRFLVSRDPSHEGEWDGKHRATDPQSPGRRVLENLKAARDDGAPHDQPFGLTRNKRTVWTIATEAFAGRHFATFPQELAATCIAAGTSEKGCCPQCGAGWERVTEHTNAVIRLSDRAKEKHGDGLRTAVHGMMLQPPRTETTGWRPTCRCSGSWQKHWDVIDDGEGKRRYHETYEGGASAPAPCIVLDPFAGSGTVGLVAFGMGRRFVLVEISGDYVAMTQRRIPPMAFSAPMCAV